VGRGPEAVTAQAGRHDRRGIDIGPDRSLYHIGNSQGAIAVRLNVGAPFVLYRPTVTGTVTGYSVSPVLPAGVSLSPSTGVISGTPLVASPEAPYTITATNDGGSATTIIYVTVFTPPSALSYASPVNGTVGAALTGLAPTLSGDADNFSVGPALPAGLVLDSTTGVVSGTPTTTRVPAIYTITASNLGGASTTFDLLLAVTHHRRGPSRPECFGIPQSLGSATYRAHTAVCRIKAVRLPTKRAWVLPSP
jgi:hypothetical protein